MKERVKLKELVGGGDIYEAVMAAEQALHDSNFYLQVYCKSRYEPGSVKQAIDSFTVAIVTKKRVVVTKRSGFLWRKKQVVEEHDIGVAPAIYFSTQNSDSFATDYTYKEFEIEFAGPLKNYYSRRLTTEEKTGLRDAFHGFLEVFYRKLDKSTEL